MRYKIDGDQRTATQEAWKPTKSQVLQWLSDSNIFSLLDLMLFASDFSIPINLNTQNQKTVATLITHGVLQQGKLNLLLEMILDRRPYLESNTYPEKFPQKIRERLESLLTQEYIFLMEDVIRELCDDLGFDVDDELLVDTYYYLRVREGLNAIERYNLTKHPVVLKFIRSLPRREAALKIFKQEKIDVSNKISKIPNEAQEKKVVYFLQRVSEADLKHIIALYDFRAYANLKTGIQRQVELLIYYFRNTQTFPRLVAAIHHIFPNIDFSEYGMGPKIRQPKEVKKLKQKENVRQYPHTISVASQEKLGTYFYKNIRQTQLSAIIGILGYDLKANEMLAGPNLVRHANNRSEIHLLLMAYEQVIGATVPNDAF